MIVLRSLVSAFLMYSKIPMPRVEWRDENRRYALCFFPLIGAVIGGVLLLWRWFCRWTGFAIPGTLLNAAVCTAIPIIITGGIHLDGFCDVSDAVSSHAERSKKLEILSDPRIGAFAAIKLVVYLLIQTALFSELSLFRAEIVAAIGFVLSRALSGLAAVCFKNAKREGSLWAFTEPAHKTVTLTVLGIITAVCIAAMIFVSPLCGGAAVIASAISFIGYRLFAYRQFGGITGDTAGWFLQICELLILAAAVIGELVGGITQWLW